MYETEANHKTESGDQIPSEVLRQFHHVDGKILKRTVLPWSEHCTECVWPTCYSTCELYDPREDGRCRRFADGMVRIDCASALSGYLLKIRFKRWAKLWTPGTIRLHTHQEALKREQRDLHIGTTLYQLPVPQKLKNLATGKRYSFKKRVAYAEKPSESDLPTSFMIECYNPDSKVVRLTLTMRSVDERVRVPFQQLIELRQGFHRVRVPFEQITKFLDLRTPFNVELTPNEDETQTVLFFGTMEFVCESTQSVKTKHDQPKKDGKKKVKCIVWDLDNTVWDGILVEDGVEKLKLKPEMIEVLESMDQRGILHSVASKNNHDEALVALRKFGIDEYFLCPQISWNPKSGAIQQIAAQLNIGIDSLLFVDDSEFELQEVSATHPEVRTLNARQYLEIPGMEVCKVPVTAESRERRKMYRVESERQDIAESFGQDYMAFLRYCDIRLNLHPLMPENLERVHELTQRTNQMNFSGNRYERDVLKQILGDPHLDTYVLDVEDRFGSYGIVGFSIVDRRVPLMTDLMFSCRVQAKRVEHAFLGYILQKYISETDKDFYANYRKTSRNAPSGRVFADVGMNEIESIEGVSRLRFPREQAVPHDQVIRITAHSLVAAENL
jgi:FkbH-like protein